MSDGSTGKAQQRRRILIVDASPLLRRGLAALIDNEPDLAVCAAVATAREALDAIAAAGPALVIADFSFKPGLGLDLVREIRARHHGLSVLMMSIDDGPVYVERALEAGASGCVSKQVLNGKALSAIRAALGGVGRTSPAESLRRAAEARSVRVGRCPDARRGVNAVAQATMAASPLAIAAARWAIRDYPRPVQVFPWGKSAGLPDIRADATRSYLGTPELMKLVSPAQPGRRTPAVSR
jgi:DNA-binding NarL/FixJ family response regulator